MRLDALSKRSQELKMTKVCLMFPGQGSQVLGMGKDLYDNYQEAKKVFDIAGDDLKKVVFEGQEETLKLTKWTQPAIFTVSIAAFEVLKSKIDISKFDFVAAGHSLGEYSALCAAGFFSFSDGLKIVQARGGFLQAASEKSKGAMAAILGMDKQKLGDICNEVSSIGICEMANFNCPGQIVISGMFDAVNKAIELANVQAAKCILLNVSGAFHSSLMTQAAQSMSNELDKYSFTKPNFAVYTNCDAALSSDISAIKPKLVKQINNAVKWDESITNIIKSGFDTFIELGTGRVLSGLLRKIDKSKKALNIEDCASLDKTLAQLN
jgi:[acyl-carrier-protein] S-malonyltransferase